MLGKSRRLRRHGVGEDMAESFGTVASELVTVRAIAECRQADVTALADDLERLGERLAYVTRGSQNRLVRRMLDQYDAAAGGLRESQHRMADATAMLTRYAQAIGVVLPELPYQASAPAWALRGPDATAGDSADDVAKAEDEVDKAGEPLA